MHCSPHQSILKGTITNESLSSILLTSSSFDGCNTIHLSKSANPIYYNTETNSKLLFIITPFSSNVYFRSFQSVPLIIHSSSSTKHISHDSMFYLTNITDITIECFIQSKLSLRFNFELSKSLPKCISNSCVPTQDSSMFYEELTYEDSSDYLDKGNQCNICLNPISNVATLKECSHSFCFDCISKWSQYSTECPICKQNFSSISHSSTMKRVKKKKFHYAYDDEDVMNDDIVKNSCDYCMVCHQGNDRDVMLICDKCKYNVCHIYCDGLDRIPDGDWLCSQCRTEKRRKKHMRKYLLD